MASIRTKPTGSKAIQVIMPDGARRAIGIGKVGAKAAESYRGHISHLESALLGGHSMPVPTAQWAAQTKPQVRRRLEELGLIESQLRATDVTLACVRQSSHREAHHPDAPQISRKTLSSNR